MIDLPKYCVLDSSILIKWLDKDIYKQLSTPQFLNKNGFPLISLNALIEVAGTENYKLFISRISKLASIDSLFTLNVTHPHIPGSVVDLHVTEIKGLVEKKLKSIDERRTYISNSVSKIDNEYLKASAPVLYDYASQNKSKSNLLSSVNDHILNPIRDYKIRDIGDRTLDFSNDENAEYFSNWFPEFIQSRGKKVAKETAVKISNDFMSELGILKSKSLKFNTVRSFLRNLVGDPLVEEKKISYYIEKIEFNSILKQVSSALSMDYELLKKIEMEDVKSFTLKRKIKDYIEIEIERDSKRSFELSNHGDILLATYSLVFNTIVDKRTFPILVRVNHDFEEKLQFCKEGTL